MPYDGQSHDKDSNHPTVYFSRRVLDREPFSGYDWSWLGNGAYCLLLHSSSLFPRSLERCIIMGRGRKSIQIDKFKLQQKIQELEGNQTFAGQTDLLVALGEAFSCSHATVRKELNRHTLWDTITTKAGKRGRTKGDGPVPSGKRESRSRLFETKVGKQHVNAVTSNLPASQAGRAERFANGSMKAAVELMCLDCVGACAEKAANQHDSYSEDIRECNIIQCPLWMYRPYKKKEENA